MRVGEAHYIISRLNGYVITALGADNNSQITLQELNPKSTLQQWIYQKDGTIALASNLDRVIDIEGNDRRKGAPIHLWVNNGGLNQQWIFTKNLGIQSKLNDLFVDVSGEEIKENSRLIMYDANEQRNQMWTFIPLDLVSQEIIDFNKNLYKHIRELSTVDFAIDIEIVNETKLFTLGGFESFVQGGSLDLQVLDKQRHLITATGKSKSELSGVVTIQVREADETFAIAFSMKKSLFGGRSNAFGMRFLTEVDAANEKLFGEMQVDKNHVDVYESMARNLVVSSTQCVLRGSMTRGNKALMQIVINRK